MKSIHVAVGVLVREQQVFIARRAGHQHQGGKWEFPGGKVEAGETVFAALQREFMEEVGIMVQQAQPWFVLEYAYPDKHVTLDMWRITESQGLGQGLEGQPVAWVPLAELAQLEFPEANAVIIERLLALYAG